MGGNQQMLGGYHLRSFPILPGAVSRTVERPQPYVSTGRQAAFVGMMRKYVLC